MLRTLFVLVVIASVFAAAYGSASSLTVGSGTAATGSGDVAKCGDVDGSTYILKGQTVNSAVQDDTVTGSPSDITKATHVNIETADGCDGMNAFIALYAGENGTGTQLATGSCTIASQTVDNDGALIGEADGLGWAEGNAADNVAGCTAQLSGEVGVSAIESLVVTMT